MLSTEKLKKEISKAKDQWLDALMSSGSVQKKVTRTLENEWEKLLNSYLGVSKSFSGWRLENRNGEFNKTINELAQEASSLIKEELRERFRTFEISDEMSAMLMGEYKDAFLRETKQHVKYLAKLDGQAFVAENISLLVSEEAAEKSKAVNILKHAMQSMPSNSFGARQALKQQILKLEKDV